MFVPNLSLHGIHTVSLLDQVNHQMPKLDHEVIPLTRRLCSVNTNSAFLRLILPIKHPSNLPHRRLLHPFHQIHPQTVVRFPHHLYRRARPLRGNGEQTPVRPSILGDSAQMRLVVDELDAGLHPLSFFAVIAVQNEDNPTLVVFMLPMGVERYSDSLEGCQRNAAAEDRCIETLSRRRFGPDVSGGRGFDCELGGKDSVARSLVLRIGKCKLGCHSNHNIERFQVLCNLISRRKGREE